jgi:hypothetical protein
MECVIFHPEYGGSRFLIRLDIYLQNCTVSHPKKFNFHILSGWK